MKEWLEKQEQLMLEVQNIVYHERGSRGFLFLDSLARPRSPDTLALLTREDPRLT